MQRGQTALIRAAATGVPTFVRILLNAGANADAMDTDVRIINTYHVFCRCSIFKGNHMVRRPESNLNNKHPIFLVDSPGSCSNIFQTLECETRTAILHAVEHGHVECVELLVKHGAQTEFKNSVRFLDCVRYFSICFRMFYICFCHLLGTEFSCTFNL
jgi:ankyrin repeat protein